MSPHEFFSPYWRTRQRRKRNTENAPDILDFMEFMEWQKEKQEQKEKEKQANEKKPPKQTDVAMGYLQWFAFTVTFGYPLGWLWWTKVLKPLLQ